MTKRIIHLITEETRYGAEAMILGVPDDIEIVEEHLSFDTKYGELTAEGVQEQVDLINDLLLTYPNEGALKTMLEGRLQWLEDDREYEARNREAMAAQKQRQIDNAKELLKTEGLL